MASTGAPGVGGLTQGDAGTGACLLVPTLTQGPFFVDEHLNRSDIRFDSKAKGNAAARPGLPLRLAFSVFGHDGSHCAPLPGAQVDIWHCDGLGLYSDVRNFGGPDTRGQNFLRGYQLTDAGGRVTFTTIYPGWYFGRTVHVHLKVRLFDAAKHTTTEATTQLFFDDAVTDAIYRANPPYQARGPRQMRNADDDIYGGRTMLVLPLEGDNASGYSAGLSIGVQLGKTGGEPEQFPGPRW